MERLQRRLAVARGDEPADLVVRGGRGPLRVHEGVARDRRRDRGRRRRGASATTKGARTSTPPGAGSCRASSTPTCTSSRRSSCPTSSRGSCCPWGRRPSSPTRTSSRTCSAPTACTGSSTPAPDLPLDFYFMASSCVPASPFESPRRPLTPGRPREPARPQARARRAEMMNFPGVIAGDEAELAKLDLEERSTSTATHPGSSARS